MLWLLNWLFSVSPTIMLPWIDFCEYNCSIVFIFSDFECTVCAGWYYFYYSCSWDVFIFSLLCHWLIWILPIIEYVILVDGLSAALRNYPVFYSLNFWLKMLLYLQYTHQNNGYFLVCCTFVFVLSAGILWGRDEEDVSFSGQCRPGWGCWETRGHQEETRCKSAEVIVLFFFFKLYLLVLSILVCEFI